MSNSSLAANGAPTSTSRLLSPLTSPASATDQPANSELGCAVDAEAASAERREVDRRRRPLPEDDVGGARLLAEVVVGLRCSHDDVGEAVAVDVACRGDRKSGVVTLRSAVDPETASAEAREVDRRRRSLPEDDVRRAGGVSLVVRRRGRADDHVHPPVAVDVSRTGDRPADAVARCLADDPDPRLADEVDRADALRPRRRRRHHGDETDTGEHGGNAPHRRATIALPL